MKINIREHHRINRRLTISSHYRLQWQFLFFTNILGPMWLCDLPEEKKKEKKKTPIIIGRYIRNI